MPSENLRHSAQCLSRIPGWLMGLNLIKWQACCPWRLPTRAYRLETENCWQPQHPFIKCHEGSGPQSITCLSKKHTKFESLTDVNIAIVGRRTGNMNPKKSWWQREKSINLHQDKNTSLWIMNIYWQSRQDAILLMFLDLFRVWSP